MKTLYGKFNHFLGTHWEREKTLSSGFWLIVIFMNLSFLASLGPYLSQTAKPHDLLYSRDNDGAYAVETLGNTAWYKSNHFHVYGNLYYRLAHTLDSLSPLTHPLSSFSVTEGEKKEERDHFLLMLTSALSLLALCFSFFWVVLKNLSLALFFAPLLASISLRIPAWTEMIFRPHPDFLLALSVFWGGWSVLNYLENPHKKSFTLMAILWGLALGVKSTVIIFGPSFLLLFALTEKKESWRNQALKVLSFGTILFLAYFVIGFPQTVSFWKLIVLIFKVSQHSFPASLQGYQGWWDLFTSQSGIWIGAGLLAGLIAGLSSGSIYSKKTLTLFSVFTILSLIFLTARTFQGLPIKHYPIPFVPLIALNLSLILARVLRPWGITKTPINRAFLASVLVIGLILAHQLTPLKVLEKRVEINNHCVKEDYELFQVMKKWEREGEKIVVDPYIFHPRSSASYREEWGMTFDKISSSSVIALSPKFYKRFLNPNPYILLEDEEAQRKKEFYSAFHLAKNARVQYGEKNWTLVYQDRCHHQLWSSNEKSLQERVER